MMEDITRREYELAAMVNEEAVGQEIEVLLASMVKDGQVEIQEKNPAKEVDLAYPIKKHRTAVLLVFRLLADSQSVKKINEGLRFNNNVLRFLIVTPPVQRQQVSGRENRESVQNIRGPRGPEITSNELLSETLEKLESQEEVK